MTDSVAVIDDAGSPAVPRSQRIAGILGWVFIWLGLLTAGFVVHQLFITTWLAELNQSELDVEREVRFETAVISQIEYVPSEPGTRVESSVGSGPAPPGQLVAAPLLLQVESPPEPHTAFALIRIPNLDSLEDGWNVVEGARRSDLRTGAGHVPWTPLPGQPGNAVISGHRTSYGAPFRDLDELVAGDRIEVETALGTHVYEMRESVIVKPTDTWVLADRGGAWLTLTTCHPEFSARQRLVVFAELVEGPNAEVIGGAP